MTRTTSHPAPQWKRAALADADVILPMMEEFCRLLHIPWHAAERREHLRYLAETPEAGGVWFVEMDAEAGAATGTGTEESAAGRSASPVAAGYFALTFGFSFEFRGRYGLLDELYVDERFRKHGLGGSALACVKDIAPSLGLRRLLIEVAVESPGLAAYYTRNGFPLREYRLHTREVTAPSPAPA